MMADEFDVAMEEFKPEALPLGTFAPFDVSDQPMWTTQPGEYQLTDIQKNAIRAMTDAAAKADSVARRIEVQGAWLLELLDRGFHRLVPKNGGWEIYGSSASRSTMGVYGAAAANNYHDTNVIGEKNDIIVAALTRDLAEATFVPEKPDNPDDECYAAEANNLKDFHAQENNYGSLQAQVARYFCTDDRCVAYTRPVADSQRWGFEDIPPEVVPEMDGESEGEESDRPKIRTVTEIFGKLYHKCPMMAKSASDMQYQMICQEIDVALARAKFPWIAQQISAGDLGVSEIKLDRLARQSIHLAMQSNFATGDSLMRDVTLTRIWFRPGFYMDDSCPKDLRPWFWQTFPKGFLAVFAGGALAFVRSENMSEVLTEPMHCRSGNGQNRRALTESYMGPQMRLNVLVDLWDEFCRKEIPRVGLNTQYFNVDAIRTSPVRVGVYEPFTAEPGSNPAAEAIVPFPTPSHQATLPAFIEWLSGPLAEQLTHAMPALAASEGDDPETLGQSKLQNQNAMSSFGEAWKAICQGFAEATTQAVAWNARVQPEGVVFDSCYGGQRVRAEIAKLKQGAGVARADATANFPQSWAEREAAWNQLLSDTSPLTQQLFTDPRNLAAMKRFAPEGLVLPGVDAVEKQTGEFDKLLQSGPQDNPQYLKMQMLLQQGIEELQQQAAMGQIDEQKAALVQQASQLIQQIPPLISSVPVRADGSETDSVEALVCFAKMNDPEGRRLASSQNPDDQKRFMNLHLHWQQHTEAAKKLEAQNQQPIQPRTSVTLNVADLPPEEQASALQKMGIAASPQSIQQDDALVPHEYTTKEKGVGPSGSEIERTVSVVGKQLN